MRIRGAVFNAEIAVIAEKAIHAEDSREAESRRGRGFGPLLCASRRLRELCVMPFSAISAISA
jgi:hypothetical protein